MMNLSDFDFGQDYFELFCIPRDFQVDLQALDKRYRFLQSAYHPDRYASNEPRERLLAVQASSWVNTGYQILRDTAKRARYLLELNGISFNDDRDTTADPEFLMRQMEWREMLEELERKKGPIEDVDRLEAGLRHECGKVFNRFQTAYGSGSLDKAKLMVLQMGFYTRLLGDLDRLIERLQENST